MNAPAFQHRYAAHLGFRSFDTPLFRNAAASVDPVDQIRFAADIGMAGILDPWHLSRPVPDRARIVETVRETGLAAGTLVCALANELRCPLWQPRDPEARAKLEARMSDAFTAAAALGSTTVGVVTGRHWDLDAVSDRDLFVETLSWAGVAAADAGMTLAVEAINPLNVPGLLVDSFEDCETIVRTIGLPSVRVMFDTAHLQGMEGDVIGRFRRTADVVAVVQIANHPGRTEPAVGEIDMSAVLAEVLASGYDGLIELEHLWSTDDAETERTGIDWLREIDAAL